jgi:hypothetical protein
MDITSLLAIPGFPVSLGLGMLAGIYIFAIIVTILKGFALFKAAKLSEKKWFWVLFLLNTAGILEAYYLISRRGR